MSVLCDGNFHLYAAQHYQNANCLDEDEFEDDLNRIKYLKKLFRKYEETGDLKERLVLNHLTVLYNVFSADACTKMLCFKLRDHLSSLKPFLIFMNLWPKKIDGISGGDVLDSDVTMDQGVVDVLRGMR